MWTNEQLDNASYESYVDADTKQPLNVGTFEVQGTAYQGPYLCVPVPPFGSVKNGDGYAGLGQHVHVPARLYKEVPMPSGFPAPQYGAGVADGLVLHRYGKGTL